MPLFNEGLYKAIMTQSRLHNAFLQNRSEENIELFAKHRNYCVSLIYFNLRSFRGFQASSKKFISHNTELKPTRESLSTQNFQILPFVKV